MSQRVARSPFAFWMKLRPKNMRPMLSPGAICDTGMMTLSLRSSTALVRSGSDMKPASAEPLLIAARRSGYPSVTMRMSLRFMLFFVSSIESQ